MRNSSGDKEEIREILNSIIGLKDKKERSSSKTLDQILEKSKDNVKKFERFVPKESEFFFVEEKKPDEKINLKYEFKKDDKKYNVNVGYFSGEKEERVEVSVDVRDEIDEEIKKYGISIKKEEKGYTLLLKYDGISERYDIPINSYQEFRENQLQDFTNQVDKSLEILPESIMGGVLGFTYLGENYMARRRDLFGDKALMVDVHEAIHTPDEYETRVLTAWMLTRVKVEYKR